MVCVRYRSRQPRASPVWQILHDHAAKVSDLSAEAAGANAGTPARIRLESRVYCTHNAVVSSTLPEPTPMSAASSLKFENGRLSQWFSDEVKPHEPVLRSYLRGAFPAVRDLDDVVQESFLRIWRARLARPVFSTKAFLFQVARHLAFDELRRLRAPVHPLRDWSGLAVLDENPDAAEALDRQEKIALLSDALAALPDRCREVVYLRKFRSLPQKEVAAQLGISVRTVESQFARGMRLCEDFLRRRGVREFCRHE